MAQTINDMIKTSSKVVPMIYAYTTPGITYHDGYIKIGYTEQDVDLRIKGTSINPVFFLQWLVHNRQKFALAER